MRTFTKCPSWKEIEGYLYSSHSGALYCSSCGIWIGIEESDRDKVILIGQRSEMGHKDLVMYSDFKIHCPSCQKEIFFTL